MNWKKDEDWFNTYQCKYGTLAYAICGGVYYSWVFCDNNLEITILKSKDLENAKIEAEKIIKNFFYDDLVISLKQAIDNKVRIIKRESG